MMEAHGEFAENTQFAWYVYRADNKEPEFKSAYSTNPILTYVPKSGGLYYSKVFVKSGAKKVVVKSGETEV